MLGIVATRGFKSEVVPLAGLNRGTCRGDVLLIGTLRNVPRAEDGATWLHCASRRGWMARITQLVIEDKAKVEAADKNGMTPLHWAAAAGQHDAVKEHVRRGAVIEAKDMYGDTPWSWPVTLATPTLHASFSTLVLRSRPKPRTAAPLFIKRACAATPRSSSCFLHAARSWTR